MSDIPPGSTPPAGATPPPADVPPHAPPPPAGYQPQPPGYAPPVAQPPQPGYQPYPGTGQLGPGGTTATQFGELATFGVRLGGWLLDALLYGVLMAVLATPGLILFFNTLSDECVTIANQTRCSDDVAGGVIASIALMFVGFIIVAFVYLFQLAKSGRTWGRKIVGIKVINEQTGEAPGWGKAIGRQLFASFISAQIIYIGYLWMLWDDKKQTLHDKVAGTHVIKV